MKCFICKESMSHDVKIQKNFIFRGNYSPSILVCNDCGLRNLDPILSQDEYGDIYNNDYFSNEGGKCGEVYEGSTEDRMGIYRFKIAELDKLYPGAKNLLDIGAAKGDFLRLAKEKYECEGVELSQDAINIAFHDYGIVINHGSTSMIKEIFNNKFFDLIHMHHVFEHLIDPRLFLCELRENMHKGSIFMFEVPNQFNSLNEVVRNRVGMRSKLTGLHAVHHPYFYTRKSLKLLLEQEGYEVISIKTVTAGLKARYSKNIVRRVFLKIQHLLNRGSVIEVVCRLKM